MRRTPRLAGIALAAAALLVACGDDDDTGGGTSSSDTTASTASTATTSGDGSSTTTATTAAPEPEGTVLEVVVTGGAVESGARDEQVSLGDEVTIRVTADVADEIHVHGYDLVADTAPGQPADITFVADIPGQFEVELHDAGLQLLNLIVA